MFSFTTIVLYAIALQLVHALPVMKRIVISPPITSPKADTIWTPGSSQLVTWDTSVVPANGTFPGMLVLGRQTPGSENLDLNEPLATGFSLRDGSVHVTCPTVSPGNNYIVVLFGDSGNASPPFTISGPSASDSPTSTSTPGVASPSTQPSSTGPAPSPPVSTTSTSSTSGPLALVMTTSATVSQDKSSPGYTSPSASSSQESTSLSASTAPPAPLSGLNSNNAISRIQNPGAIIASAVVSVFTIFLL